MQSGVLLLAVYSLVCVSGLEFVSKEAFCDYHCSPLHIRQAYRHLQETSECNAANCGTYRRLAAVQDGNTGNARVQGVNATSSSIQEIDFMACRNLPGSTERQKQVVLSIGDLDSNPFKNFPTIFFEAYDALIASNLNETEAVACQLQFFQEQFFDDALSSDDDTDPFDQQPMLVRLHNGMDEKQCLKDIDTIWDREKDESSIPAFLTRSDDDTDVDYSVLLLHMDNRIGQQLLDLDCIISVVALPAILKLTPFARSVDAPDTWKELEAPALSIELVTGADQEKALSRLNKRVENSTGLSNIFSAVGANDLEMIALEDFETWSKAVAAVVDDDAVEWVDRKVEMTMNAMLRGVTDSIENRFLSDQLPPVVSTHRELDEYVQDIVGVSNFRSFGIKGSGMVVGITDTGLYLDHDQFDQDARDIFDQANTSARKVIRYNAFANKVDESREVTCGHGTHVSGLLAGSSVSGEYDDLGIASAAKIAFMDIGKQDESCAGSNGCDVHLETPSDVEELVTTQVEEGAQVFSFSWGTGGNDYNAQSRKLDAYIYEHPNIFIIVAAGNSGSEGSRTISAPSGAKNVLSIGASLNAQASFSSSATCPDLFNERTVASFSSIGPTMDGRLKPDLVAPGMTLTSAESQKPGTNIKTNGMCDLKGSSQATPIVAGMAVLLHEWLRDGYWKHGAKDPAYSMSNVPASLLKALLIHSGRAMEQRMDDSDDGITSCVALEDRAKQLDTYPDYDQGYGLPTLATFLGSHNGSLANKDMYFYPNASDKSQPRVRHGEESSFLFMLRPGANLRITIVWTDPPGSQGSRSMLQNDLDLFVRIPSQDGQQSTKDVNTSSNSVDTSTPRIFPLSGKGQRDGMNNVEMLEVSFQDAVSLAEESSTKMDTTHGVLLEAVVAGYSVKAGNEAGQDFALVASSLSGSLDTTLAADKEEDGGLQAWMIVVCVLVGTLAIVCVLLGVWAYKYKKKNADELRDSTASDSSTVSMEVSSGSRYKPTASNKQSHVKNAKPFRKGKSSQHDKKLQAGRYVEQTSNRNQMRGRCEIPGTQPIRPVKQKHHSRK